VLVASLIGFNYGANLSLFFVHQGFVGAEDVRDELRHFVHGLGRGRFRVAARATDAHGQKRRQLHVIVHHGRHIADRGCVVDPRDQAAPAKSGRAELNGRAKVRFRKNRKQSLGEMIYG